MKEIEILVELYDNIESVKNRFNDFEYLGLNHVIDEYYYDPKRNDLKPNENMQLDHCLRLRSKNDKYYITYKDDVFEDDVWLYSNEYETKIENIDMMREIFDKLGLKKLLVIDNKKETYKYKDYEIVLEEVDDLGLFMEVEYCTDMDVNVKSIKLEIQEFIDNLGISVSEELNMGKPEMFLRKNSVIVFDE